MTCPTCKNLLQKLPVTTNAGGRFNVDHCGKCGGTWFDTYEINRIPYHEVVRLAHETVIPKKSIHATVTTKHCPRCFKILEKLHGSSVPSGVDLIWCPKCAGIWATQKALIGYKRHQEETISEIKEKGKIFPSLSAIFAPTLLVLLLLISTFITLRNIDDVKETQIRATSLIENLNIKEILPGKATIYFQTKTPVTSTISYGVSSFSLITHKISKDPSTTHTTIIRNLKPSSTYIYNITLIDQNGKSYFSKDNIFTTK